MDIIHNVEIEGFGEFSIKHDYRHRGRSRLVTFEKGRFKEVQFNSFDYRKTFEYQDGYDYESSEIRIKVID